MHSMFTILVIDDDAGLRESLTKYLVKLGCDVSTADTAETGIQKIQRVHYDAIFASLCMHRMGGRGIARWVRKNNGSDTKVFITTSWKGELEKGMLHYDGINDVIRKPFSFSEVRDKVLEHLG